MTNQKTQSRILLVDDEEGIRYTLGLLLKKEGYQVDGAADLDTARELLRGGGL